MTTRAKREERILAGLKLVDVFLCYAKPKLPFWLDEEDVRQAGVMGLIGAVDDFDESKASFPTFAMMRIRRAVIQELRDAVGRTPHHRGPKRAVTLHSIVAGALVAPDGRADPEREAVVARALGRLPDKRAVSIARGRFWRGRTYKQLRFKISTGRLWQIWRQAKAELKADLTRAGYGE